MSSSILSNPSKNKTTKTKPTSKTLPSPDPNQSPTLLHQTRFSHILAHCRQIWAPHTDFDLACNWVNLDNVQGWSIEIRKAYGDAVHVKEFWTMPKKTEEKAWGAMEGILGGWG
ncbi:hypothetical protein FKW77_007428 [Venturia effusa]|uniref:Uncharacterized protein n=1 Tax=Venturia effusa TaxID=50376 RepID=A0A517LKI8_9PEZI|nr:hypothetical protein FKW77_007428 [Venturia effusa]